MLEEIASPAEVIPSAPPLPDFAHSFPVEESSLSQFHENIEGVTEDKLVDKNPISQSLGSLIIQQRSAALPNAGRPAQSDQVSKRSKLKSVKSLRIDTGRNSDKSNALS